MILDYRTPLEKFWHARVRGARVELERRSGPPLPGLQYSAALRPMGTAHASNPADPFMRWTAVFAKIVKLFEVSPHGVQAVICNETKEKS